MITHPPYKINIGLNIINRREDLFHNIETVFYSVDNLTDELEINRVERGVKLSVFNMPNLCAIEENLCVKAFRLLQKDFPIDGIDIKLTKNIPVGAGLGGGSADGAFAIKMYNQLFNLNLSNKEMQNYAARLGSDTSFFIDSCSAFATGRGEILTPLNLNLSDFTVKMMKPDFSISTQEAYSGIVPHHPVVSLRWAIEQPIEQWKTLIVNDFENHLFHKYPILNEIKHELYAQGAVYASLSGSGSAVYGIF